MRYNFISGVAIVIVPLQYFISVVFLLRGHNMPGGGFIGGLILGIGLTFSILADNKIPKLFQMFEPLKFIILGLFISTVAGLLGAIDSGIFLKAIWISEVVIPFVGEVKIGTVLLFDFGIYILVAGFILKLVNILK